MDMVSFYDDKNNVSTSTTSKFNLNVAAMVGQEITLDPSKYSNDDGTPKKKRININGKEVASREDELPQSQSNVPYKESYSETNAILKTAITQLDLASQEITEDIHDIRGSKTLRKKYDYLTNMYGSFGNLVGNKISAARELNNSIKNAHELELKRIKDLKLNEQVDDTKAIMDTYNAFVSMPVSANPLTNGYSSPLGPTTMDLTLRNNNMITSAIANNADAGYENYLRTMSPEQAMMFYESNPDIKQVVVYNQDTFEKHFEVMNMKTKEILHGLPKRNDAMYMQDTYIDTANKVARNTNLDEVYDVVIVGTGDMSQY
jgi:hypothetical protein